MPKENYLTNSPKRTILEGFAQKVFKEKYAISDSEEWWQCAQRSATHAASAESPENREQYEKEFYNIINNLLFIPGGRIVYSSGRPRPSGANCFALSVNDSRESIGQLFADFMIISSSGGGVGINFSKLRPKGDPIKSIGGESSGAISWMHVINSMGDVIRAGGSRRMACLAALSVSHPEILDFINAKLGTHKKYHLTNMNISVLLNDEFIEAVQNNEDYNLSFRGEIYQTVNAREVWELICQNAIECGEPGIMHEDNFRRGNNLEYFQPFVVTNPCSELGLGASESCVLGSLNLNKMFSIQKDNTIKVNARLLKKTVKTAVRFLDNVVTANHYPTAETQASAKMGRRIGLGVMGLHHLLIRLGLTYGSSEETVEFLDWLNTTIRNAAYNASIELAQERRSFQEFNPKDYLANQFIKTLPRSIKNKIKKYGIRNAALLTVPPTGTISIIASTSSGLEPIFALAYDRKTVVSENGEEKLRSEIVIDPLVKEMILANVPLEKIQEIRTAHALSPDDHLAMQVVYQDYIDNSISKTIFLPEDFDDTTAPDLVLDHIQDIKGLSFYKDKSRENQPITPIELTQELYDNVQKSAGEDYKEKSIAIDTCRDGVCEL